MPPGRALTFLVAGPDPLWLPARVIFETVWRHSVHQRAYLTRSAVGSGRLVVNERASRLVGLDVRDGGVRWDVPLGNRPQGLTVTGGHCLALSHWGRRLSCHEPIAGELRWHAELPAHTGHLAVAGGVAVVGGWRGYTPLAGYDLDSGALLWRSGGPVAIEEPLAFGDRVLLAERGTGLIRAVEPRTGRDQQTWRLPEPVLEVDTGPVLARLDVGRVLVRGTSGALWVLNPITGEMMRQPAVPAGVRAVAVAGGLLWCDDGEQVVALESGVAQPWTRVPHFGRLVGVAAVDSGFALAGHLGRLTLVGHDGGVVGRATVDKRIGSLHGADRDRVLALGKSEVLAVDLRP